MLKIILAILVFSIIVIVHEFGHYIVAKANGVMVLEFSIGFGPRLLHFKKGETIYSIKAIPFGGACIMLSSELGLDEENQEQEDDEPDYYNDDPETKEEEEKLTKVMGYEFVYKQDRSFESKSTWARLAILAAGPLFNFLLALICAIVIIGNVGYDPVRVDVVYDNSPAAQAGLQVGDIITSANGKNFTFARELTLYRYFYPEKPLDITYLRDGKEYSTTVETQHSVVTKFQVGVTITAEQIIASVSENSPAKEAGFKVNDKVISVDGRALVDGNEFSDAITQGNGRELAIVVKRDGNEVTLKCTPKLVDVDSYYVGFACYGNREMVSPMDAVSYSFKEVGYWISYVFDSFKMMFEGKVTVDDLSGPVGVVTAVGQVVEESKDDGWFYVMLNLFNMIVLISANLGVMNLLPLPAIDGGKIIFILIEIIRGKPVDKKKEGIVNMIGMALLFLLMIYVMFNDIRKLF